MQFVSLEGLVFQKGGILGSIGEGGKDISSITPCSEPLTHTEKQTDYSVYLEVLLSFRLPIALNINPVHAHFYSLQRNFLDIISFDLIYNVMVRVTDVVCRASIIFFAIS